MTSSENKFENEMAEFMAALKKGDDALARMELEFFLFEKVFLHNTSDSVKNTVRN